MKRNFGVKLPNDRRTIIMFGSFVGNFSPPKSCFWDFHLVAREGFEIFSSPSSYTCVLMKYSKQVIGSIRVNHFKSYYTLAEKTKQYLRRNKYRTYYY
jgi:hypothetical protein